MFGIFARLTPRFTAGESPTELGLWIVTELVRSMNGAIRVEITLGEGPTFTAEFQPAEVPIEATA
jgi:light-regulated signal transduction histidine kinase (bacteriophytochrome)